MSYWWHSFNVKPSFLDSCLGFRASYVLNSCRTTHIHKFHRGLHPIVEKIITYLDIRVFHRDVITKTLTIMSNVTYCINPLMAPDPCNLGWPLRNICVTNDHGYVPLVVNTSQSSPHSWLITRFVIRLTRRVSIVDQELLTLLEHMSSPPVLSRVRVTRFLILYMYVLYIVACPFVLFRLAIGLFFFHIQILITPLISSNSSYK